MLNLVFEFFFGRKKTILPFFEFPRWTELQNLGHRLESGACASGGVLAQTLAPSVPRLRASERGVE